MSTACHNLLIELSRFSKDQIGQAGHRYTPGVDPQAPNLRIESLCAAIENVGCGRLALARFESFLTSFGEAWNGARHGSPNRDAIGTSATDARAALPELIERLRDRDATAVEEWSTRLSAIESRLREDMAHWRANEEKLPPSAEERGYSPAHNDVRHSIDMVGRCLSIVRDEQEYVGSPAFKVLSDPRLLVGGEWGTGKTHLLCDFSKLRIERGQATLLILAKNFHGKRIVADICHRLAPGRTVDEVFRDLDDVSRKASERAVVVVDGVNEGRRSDWRAAVAQLQSIVANHPRIGLIVTCRTPFEAIAIHKSDLEIFHKLRHNGFDDQEFDAQAAFFQYYKLPLPEVPLLDREFSRPLTLKLICQSLRNLTGKKLTNGFAGIASGQKGMTYVLESFVNRVGEGVEREFALRPKSCWRLLKGSEHIQDVKRAGLAPCMAVNLRGYVRPADVDRIVASNHPSMKPTQRRSLIEALRPNGLIEEDVVWYSTPSGRRSRIVFRLPYQRFSDHLVARHLLKLHLDVSSRTSIKRSFASGAPLAWILRVSRRYRQEYAEPGLVQALITEFPERVGSRLPAGQRELYFVLPKAAKDLGAYRDPFIQGIFWRDPAAFTEATRLVMNHYLNADRETWERMVDALAAVSTKPKHPYRAKRLYRFLAMHQMPERDRLWSEYLRRRYASPTIQRLLTWAATLDSAAITEDSARELVALLSLVLTTVVRRDRDVATKALVLLGERFPTILFEHVVTTLSFNDPYVPERMLAAAYGTTLSLVDSSDRQTFLPVLSRLASALYRTMFGKRARHPTNHTLMQGYAVGIIDVAQRARCISLKRRASRNLTAPFPNVPSAFVSDGTPDPAVSEAIGRAIQMDFGNYTIGRLVPNRRNYDDDNVEYVKVRAKIERRMFDLGYRAEQFKDVDNEIGRVSWNARDENKVERYGKKYSWIAYFEMWGERDAARKLPDWRLGERTPDCGVDPTFPKRPPAWAPRMPDLFGAIGRDTHS